MISLKSFINAIQEAIISANDTLQNRNVNMLEKYFTEIDSHNDKRELREKVLEPIRVTLEYHSLNAQGELVTSTINVPLITLVPMQMPQIEKAVLSSEFAIEVVNDEIELSFAPQKSNDGLFKKKNRENRCKLEITLKTEETTDGIKLLVEGYESILKRQLV